MAKKFQVFLMIFCLGLFVVPKQAFSAQSAEMSCCSSKSDKKEDCKKEKKTSCHNSKKNKHHNCNGNCANCNTCSSGLAFLGRISNENIENSVSILISQKVENLYLTPYFSPLSKAIWQPPKIS